MKLDKQHQFKIGDMFVSLTTNSIIVVTKLPHDSKHELYHGVYTGGANEDKAERKIGYRYSIVDAINDGIWEYYPVKE